MFLILNFIYPIYTDTLLYLLEGKPIIIRGFEQTKIETIKCVSGDHFKIIFTFLIDKNRFETCNVLCISEKIPFFELEEKQNATNFVIKFTCRSDSKILFV